MRQHWDSKLFTWTLRIELRPQALMESMSPTEPSPQSYLHLLRQKLHLVDYLAHSKYSSYFFKEKNSNVVIVSQQHLEGRKIENSRPIWTT